MQRNANCKIVAIFLAISASLLCLRSAGEASSKPVADAGQSFTELSGALCPIVYPLDESSSDRGYHYTFYGNAFFIDRDGYLITAAHVLSDFHNGGQPRILLRVPEAPPRLVGIQVVATDAVHDIAVLRAVPNPFEGKYQVAFLPLAAEKPALGTAVVAAALRPSRLKDPHTFDAPQEDNAPAEVLQFVMTRLEKGQAEAELFLFSHEVIRGQSGAPVVTRDRQGVVGIVEGQWLRAGSYAAAAPAGNRKTTLGAAIPITYAIPLLEQKHIPWHKVPGPAEIQNKPEE